MKTRKGKQPDLWQYLEAQGVLENSTDEEIKAAKRAYRKIYQRQYKRVLRSRKLEYSIFLSREDGEYDMITAAAKEHHLSISAFIKSAALAYVRQVFLVPDRKYLAMLEQLLRQCINDIGGIMCTKDCSWFEREQKLDAINTRIEYLEREVTLLFRYPLSIEDAVRKALAKNPSIREKLLALLCS